MPKFGKTSKERLALLDKDLRRVLEDAIQYYDFSVVCTYRGKEDQTAAYEEGRSQLEWPNSKHNKLPSLAVDIIPYPSGYSDVGEFYTMATYVYAAALRQGVPLIWGGHWRFKDLPHFQKGD